MKSKIYSSDYVKTTSKGQVWIPVFLAIGFLMAFPVVELMMLGNWFGMNYETAQIAALYENLWRDGFMGTGFVVIALAAFINGINGFWYLYSSRKVDFYHGLPMKRNQMFWHRTYVGIVYYLVPYLVMEFLAVCIGAMRGFFSLRLMKLAMGMLLLHLLIYLLLYFSVVLVVCITGNMLMGALALAGFFIYGPLLGNLLGFYQNVFFTTFLGEDYGLIRILKEQGSPLLLGKSFLGKYADGEFAGTLAILAAVTVLLAAAACIAYRRRPSENTGKALVYSWMEPVIRFMVVVPVGLGVGLIFYMVPSSGARIPWWIFGMAAGTLLSHGIVEVLYRMDFRRFFSHKLQLVLAGLLVAACAVVFKQDLLGYDTYQPSYGKLESISIGLNQIGLESSSRIIPTGDGKYKLDLDNDGSSLDRLLKVGLDQGIYQAVGKVASREKTPDNDFIGNELRVGYTLKSGETVYRSYQVSSGERKEILKACYQEGTLKEEKYSFLQLEDQYLMGLSGSFYDGESYTLFQDEKEKKGELIQALAQDVKEADGQTMMEEPCVLLQFQYENIPVEPTVNNMTPGAESTGGYFNSVFVYPSFKRTVALLKDTGYPMSMEEVPVESVRIRYAADNGKDGFRQGDEITYDSPQQLEALKKCMVPFELGGAAMEAETELDASMRLKAGGWDVYVSLDKSRLPDFIKEDMKKAE